MNRVCGAGHCQYDSQTYYDLVNSVTRQLTGRYLKDTFEHNPGNTVMMQPMYWSLKLENSSTHLNRLKLVGSNAVSASVLPLNHKMTPQRLLKEDGGTVVSK